MRVLRLLQRAYGNRPWRQWGDPVSILVETVLSQNTSDVNSSAGYRQLRRRFRSWGAVAGAPVAEVEKCIRVSGLSRIKAPRIQAILRRIRRDRGRLSLEFLRHKGPQAATEYLRSFPGVGPKTAACVLLFSLRKAVFPVDTHILRIGKRLGWLAPSASAQKAQEALTPLIPPRRRYAMHVLLIEHGRKTCRARSPRCSWCPLLALCPQAPAERKASPGNPRAELTSLRRRGILHGLRPTVARGVGRPGEEP
jgi:endonuclease-3